MSIFLFSLFDCFSFSNFSDDFVCFGWHCSIELLVRVVLVFLFQFFELYFRTCPAMFFYFVG